MPKNENAAPAAKEVAKAKQKRTSGLELAKKVAMKLSLEEKIQLLATLRDSVQLDVAKMEEQVDIVKRILNKE